MPQRKIDDLRCRVRRGAAAGQPRAPVGIGRRLTALSLRGVLIGALIALTLGGCSQVQIGYGLAGFFIKREANAYLHLDPDQMARWEPRIDAAIETHRAQELPHLAGFFDALHQASTTGFNQTNADCLTAAFRTLYLRHARLAVALAAPPLAGLRPRQIQALDARFAADEAEDRADQNTGDRARELRKRAKRYVESIEEWTGALRGTQRGLVADITARMPDSAASVLEYRTRQREALIAVLRSGADEARVERFLTDWLVDYKDLPPDLTAAGEQIGERVAELLVRLGASLDAGQRKRLSGRLAAVRDDLLRLQRTPRLVSPSCPAAPGAA